MKLVRRLHLERHEDVSGVSGTGVVAYGVEFPDGSIVLRWDTKVASTVHYQSVEDLETITGHGGRTSVVWDDEPLSQVLPVWPIVTYGREDSDAWTVHRATGKTQKAWGDLGVRPGTWFQIRVNNEPITMVVSSLALDGHWEATDVASFHRAGVETEV